MKSLPQIVGDFFERQDLLGTGGVVAVSGGPDSVCLARILGDLVRQNAFSKLVVAHLNHQLRGAESDHDEAFVEKFASDCGLPFRSRRLDVAASARSEGANLEDTARRLRYKWFTQVAQDEGAAWVATGHSANDQAETVLFRLLRGSGLHGLAGMAARRPLTAEVELIRPLLQVDRAAILSFLEELQQAYCRDLSNLDLSFTRNRLRLELLPLLAEKYNPAIVDIFCQLAELARQVQQEIDEVAKDLLKKAELPRAGAIIVLDSETMKTARRHLRREVFRLIWAREEWPMGRMNYEAWDRLAELVEAEKGAVDLPEGVAVKNIGRVIQLQKV